MGIISWFINQLINYQRVKVADVSDTQNSAMTKPTFTSLGGVILYQVFLN